MAADKPLVGRIALITGASRGIGAAVAKAYAAAGAHVVLSARNTAALEKIDDDIRAVGGSATLIPLDLLDADKIDTLGPALAQKFGRLDIFVGNAGMLGTLGPLGHADAKEWDRVIALNLTANFRLIRTLDPLLRASDAGRVIFVSSQIIKIPRAYWGSYIVSKTALEAFAKTYAVETQKTNLRVNLVWPGTVDTSMLAQAFPGGYQGEKKKPEELATSFIDLASPACTLHGEIIKA